jgi:hypothetical protein
MFMYKENMDAVIAKYEKSLAEEEAEIAEKK